MSFAVKSAQRSPHFNRLSVAVCCALALGACSQYEYTLNGRKLYSPPQLFSDFTLEDPSLSSCVKQTILDKQIRKAADLIQLRCTYGGIRTAKGLAVFTELKQLDLSHNALENLEGIVNLHKLEELNLDANPKGICAQLAPLTSKVMKPIAPQCSL